VPTAAVDDEDPAMIGFTSGSSGTPKGVCRTHGDLRAMFAMLSNHEAKRLKGVDYCAFPAFPLDDLSAGRTSVLPCFPPGRPSPGHAAALAAQLRQFPPVLVTAPPWVLQLLANHCRSTGERFPSVRHVFSGGGVVPLTLVRELASVFSTAEFRALYGSTEAEPVSLIDSWELLTETAALTEDGAGICVGWPAPGVEVAIIEPSEEPVDALHLVDGIGEVAVSGPHVNREYYRDEALTRRHKIREAATGRCWHRMGDLGYRDAQGRLWLVGRYSSRVLTAAGPLYPDQVEPIFDVYPGVTKTALIGVDAGPRGGRTKVAALLVQFRSDAVDREGKLERVRRGCRERGLPIAAVLECERLLHDRRIGAKVQYAALARRYRGAVLAACAKGTLT
jgi:acyl-CoA synthetase (AMP-forming)/AMP-acid ligase II